MEETEAYMSIALWGTGEVDPRAASALLNDFLPDKLGSVLRPESVGRGSLRHVVNWFEGDDQLGENGTIGSVQLHSDLVGLRDAEGDDITLIVLWPEAPTQEDIAFVEEFQASGVRVLDLCGALDELLITQEMRETANPQPEKPKRLTKKQKEEAEKLNRELQEAKAKEVLELEIVQAAEIAKRMESRGQEMVTQTTPLDAAGIIQLDPWVEVGVPLEAIRQIIREEIDRAFRNYGFEKPRVHVGQDPWIESPEVADSFLPPQEVLDAARKKSKELAKRGSLSAMAEEVPVTHPATPLPEDDGSVPFDGPYLEGIEYYMTEDGNYRRSNGKPRRGETLVTLSIAEIDALQSAGQIN